MNVVLVVSTIFAVIGGLTTKPPQVHAYALRAQLSTSYESEYSIEMMYQNLDNVAHCILSSDFSAHPWRETLRITSKTGKVIEYSGKRAGASNISYGKENKEVYFSVVVVPPGYFAKASFDVSTNYNLVSSETYFIKYSLPVTPCKYIIGGLIDIPTSYLPFMIDNCSKNYDAWNLCLRTIKHSRQEWAKVGFFAELDTFVLRTKSRD